MTKSIWLNDAALATLRAIKRDDETWNGVILRLVREWRAAQRARRRGRRRGSRTS